MTKARLSLIVLAIVVFNRVSAYGQTAWLPPQGRFSVNPSYTFSTFEKFWLGRTKSRLPDDQEQHSFSVSVEYGLFDNVALDLTVGYTRTSFGPEGDTDGLDDTTLGVRWRLVDEFQLDSSYVPTLTLHVGGIIAGTYETGAVGSAGDGASGIEISLLFGKTFGDTGFGLSGSVGYRYRMEDAPDDFFASIGGYKTFLKGFVVSAAYRHVQGLSGLDIGEPGFTPERFPETQEIFDSVEAGLGYIDKGGRYYGIFVARTLDGKNTAEKPIVGALLSFPF